MAREVVWSFQADSDLESIADFIAKDSPFYAASFVREIRDVSRTLNQFSVRGHIVPEIAQSNIREIVIGKYRLIYSIEKSRVVILALIHGARDLSGLLKKRE